MSKRKIELLAPARDIECGLAAIDHGADAIYIGSPAFGARAAASNSVADIERLTQYAHKYFARVYVALNTLLTDSEIDKARELIYQLYDIGVDALIVQDLGLLECDLPPIPLHASTQCNNRTVEKVQFLEQLGFEQVVLARELSLTTIKEIHSKTGVLLEAFIHGALCVSYSGRCYISEKVTGRSANRGECAQFCRHRYQLEDSDGKILANEHVLSLKDFNVTKSLEDLLGAGVSSLKIEGRLKSPQYVKNVTAHYRKELDQIFSRNSEYEPLSSGHCSYSFSPDPFKSFNRGVTEYYLNRQKGRPAAPSSPKSIGQYVGKVVGFKGKAIRIKGEEQLHNGDGCCFFNSEGELVGFNVNRVDGDLLFPAKSVSPPKDTSLYRNVDLAFNKQLEKSDSCRKISVDLKLEDQDDHLQLTITDENGVKSSTTHLIERQLAKKLGASIATAEKQLKKSGNTIFVVNDVDVQLEPDLFVAASEFNQIRRDGFENHIQSRLGHYKQRTLVINPADHAYPAIEDDIPVVTNSFAEKFYYRHGLDESQLSANKPPLMHCKYCVRGQYGICPGDSQVGDAEPLYIIDNTGHYKLTFDCKKCEMKVDFIEK